MMMVDGSYLVQASHMNALNKIDENRSISQANSCREAADLLMHFEPDSVILKIALPRWKRDQPSAKIQETRAGSSYHHVDQLSSRRI